VVFLLADLGYPPYSESLVVRRADVQARADALRRFLVASAEGWKSYLANPAPAHALIRRDNPQMTDALLAFGHATMKQYGIVTGGDAPRLGILTMTDKRWQSTFAFVQSAGLGKPGFDYRPAYTLDLIRDVHVLP